MSESKVEAEKCLLRALVDVSEKAANIARVCRSNPLLLSLLVQEKRGSEANSRFEHDFKTLADVLIQETIKHDVGNKFPALRDSIKGEESPNFNNAFGQPVRIAVGKTETDTVKCLEKILAGNKDAARALAAEVHKDVKSHLSVPKLPSNMDYSNYGIWIDPIDATAEYIHGDYVSSTFSGISTSGLDCVTVLIGVYEKTSGIPVIGLVTQPFHAKLNERDYISLTYWGVALPNFTDNNICHKRTQMDITCIFSSSEKEDILEYFKDKDYEIVFSAGAGHKALKVIDYLADVYFLSKPSTFKWDTCAPQAILRSLGGNMFDIQASVTSNTLVPVSYKESAAKGEVEKCNKGGVLAVRDIQLADFLLKDLKQKQILQ